VAESKLHRTARQRQRLQQIVDVREFGALGAHEFLARRHVVEQVAHLHAGARWVLRRACGLQPAAIDLDTEGGLLAGGARDQREARHRRHRGQRLAAKTHAGDVFEIVEAADLAGGMRGHRQRQVVQRDAAAVVANADQPRTASLDVHLDARGAGVEAVLDQLLDHRGRPLDDLAGGDLIDEFGRKRADVGHPRTLAACRRKADQPDGIVSTAPACTMLLRIWLAVLSAPTLIPYCCAMPLRLSPRATLWVSAAPPVALTALPADVSTVATRTPRRLAACAANQVPGGGVDSK